MEEIIMPIYEFKNSETGEVVDVMIKISEYDDYLKDNPHLSRCFTKAPGLTSGTKSALTMAGSNWQEHLGNIKKGAGKENTIKT